VINSIIIPSLVAGSLYALVATGFNVLERTTHILNFAHGDLLMIAPMTTLVAHFLWHFPIWASAVTGVAMNVAVALVIDFVAIRPFLDQAYNFTWVLSTLGCSVIIEQVAAKPFASQPQAFIISSLSTREKKVGPFLMSPQELLIVLAAIAVAVALHFFYRRTRLGRMLIAVGEDIVGARSLGVAPKRMGQVAIVLAALTAAIAGITYAPLVLVTPTMGFALTFTGFVAMAIGGMGSVIGGYLGGIFVALATQITLVYAGGTWTDAALFGALLCLYLIRPQGLLGHPSLRHV